MNSSQYILAFDVGTSGAKGVLTDMCGAILFAETEAYPLISLHPGWGEQDPECYWNSVCKITKKLLSASGISPSSVAGIAFGTMWKGTIPIDRDGRILHNSLLWLDARAGEQAKQLNEKFGPGRFGAATYLSKLMWLRQEHPEIVEKAECILEVNSFLKWRATGSRAVDISNCLVASFDPELDARYAQLFDFMDIPREKFPPYVHSQDLVGCLTEDAAVQMGLVSGIPVFGGCNDLQAATVGAGCAVPGAVYAYFGSSGWIGYTRPHKTALDGNSPFDETQDVAVIGVRSIGLSFNWTARTLYKAQFESMGNGVFPLIDRDAEEIPPGSDGVLAAPWFYGEWPPLAGLNARGSFLNLAPYHDRRHMARAVMEGLCFNLRIRAEHAASRNLFTWPAALNAIGGGACSEVWMQILADIMNTEVHVPYKPQHAGAAGTACCALVGLGVWSDYAEAAKNLPIEKHFRPRPEAVKIYEKNFAVYKQLYSLLKPVFDQMNTAGTEGKNK